MPLTSLDVAKDTAPDNFLQHNPAKFYPENYNTVRALSPEPEGDNASPFLNLTPNHNPDQKIYANTPTYFQPKDVSSRYDSFLLGKDNESINAELQSGWSRAGSAADNLVEKFGAYVTQNAGFIGGAIGAATGGAINLVNEGLGGDGKVVNNGNAISNMTDNFLTNLGDAWKENVQERSPIYKSDKYTNGTIWQKLGTSSWWLDDAIDRLALTGAMLIPGIAESEGLGLFGAALDESGALKATGAGAKALQALSDNPGLYSKIGKALGSDIYKVAAEGVADINPSLALKFKGVISAAQKVELYTWNVLGQSALNGREAQVGIRKALKEQREEGLNNMTDEQIEDKAALGATKGFWYTMPLSVVASVVELPQIFSTAKTTKSLLSKFFNRETGEMVEGALVQTVKPSLGKLALKTALTGFEHGQNESAQVAIGRYLEESIAGKMVGQRVEKDKRDTAHGIWSNFLDNVNDPNGQNNIALGTIQGILMSVGGYAKSSIKGQFAAEDAANKQFINSINKAKATRRFWTTPSDFYSKDEKGNVELHQDGSPVINQDRLAEVGLSLVDIQRDNEQRLRAIENEDYDSLDRLNHKSLMGLAQNFFDDPKGMDYLTNILKFEAKNQTESIDRINDSRNGQEITPQVQLQESLDFVNDLKKAYDAIDQRHAGFTELQIDGTNKEEVTAKKEYIRDLQHAQFVNAANQIYVENRLAKNDAELIRLGSDGIEKFEDPSSPKEERINYLIDENNELEKEYESRKDEYKVLVNKDVFKSNFEKYKNKNAKAEAIVEETKTKVAQKDAEIAKDSTVDEQGNIIPNKKTIVLKTKTGERELEYGTEYYIGRQTQLSEIGKEVYSVGVIRIISDNSDGTLTVQDQDGVTKTITKEQFAEAEPIDYRKALLDKKFKWFISNWNTMFQHFLIKVNGKAAVGRLSWSPKEGKLIFKYLDEKGKARQKEVTRRDFVINNEKYKHPLLKRVGEVTAAQKAADQEFAESVDARDKAAVYDHFSVLANLYDELFENKQKNDKLITDKKNELEAIKKELTELQEKIKIAEGDKRSKKSFKFKTEGRKALSTAMRLSRMQDQLQQQLQELESDKQNIESNIDYVSDLIERVDELPNDNIDLLVELDEQKKDLNDAYNNIGKEINTLSKVIKAVENALKSAIEFIHDLIKDFEKAYPKVPRILGQEWVDFIKQNPNFLKNKPDYKKDLAEVDDMIAQVEEVDIIPNERHIEELNKSISDLQDQLKELDQQMKNRDVVMAKFEKVIEAYEQQKVEEQKLKLNTSLTKKFLGTLSKTVQNFFGKPTYEATPKKPWASVVGGTIAVTRGNKNEVIRDHHIRANNFGFRFNTLKNKEALHGVIVINSTQDVLISGLTEHLIGDTGLNPKDVIALVMVQKNANGSIDLVDQFGEVIQQKENESIADYNKRKLDSAIYQVFPSDKLEATYTKDGKEVKETMFRSTIPETVKAELTKKYRDWRTTQLKQSTLGGPLKISASFGIPEYVTYKDENGKDQRDFSARTSAIDAGLIDDKALRTEQAIIVATSNNAVTNGSVTFETPEGRVFLKVGNTGLAKLQNRKFTKEEASTIFDVIHQVAKNTLKDSDLKDTSSKLFDWLRSIVYWGIPKTPEGHSKDPGYNSIWFEETQDGLKLFMSGLGEGFDFTPTSLELNKTSIVTLIENMYNNADADLLNLQTYNEPYNQILGIDKDGSPINKVWPNYQSYLLSNKSPNEEGKLTEPRTNEDIPLVTQFRQLNSAEDTNRKGIYFTLNNTVDTFGEQNVTPVVNQEAPKAKTEVPTKEATTETQTSAPAAPVAPAPKAPTPASEYNLNGKAVNVVGLGGAGSVNVIFNGSKFMEIWNNDKIDVLDPANSEKTSQLITRLIKEKVLDFGEGMTGKTVQNVIDLLGVDDVEQAQDIIKTKVLQKLFPTAISQSVVKEDPIVDETPTQEAPTEPKKGGIRDRSLNNPSIDNSFYRLKLAREADKFTTEDWEKAEKDFAKMIPNIPFYRVKNMIDATNGRQAWGMLHDAAIYVYENAEIGTVYHEVFEAVWKMFAGPAEKQSIIDEFRNREGSYFDEFQQKEIEYSEATDQEVKEKLAEEFRDAVLNDKLEKPIASKGLISRLFSQLINFIKSFFTGKDAQRNTKELFNKIGDGYYSKYNPYETKLSYAKKGIIDIDDMAGDETSEFRINNIPAIQQHEIIQHMTFATLRDMVRTNKSLFEINKLSKVELYENLREEIKNRLAYKYQQYIKNAENGILNDQQVREMNNLENLDDNVDKEWDKIVEKHEEHLKTYSIEFDENDEIILNDENRVGKSDWQNARTIDTFRKSSSAIKILLASLPETEMVDGKAQPVFSSIGGFTLMDSSKVYINLRNKLHDSVDADDMLNKLRDIAIENPNYETLYYRMTKNVPSPGQPTSLNVNLNDLQLISAFWAAMKGQNADVVTVFILPGGETVVSDSTLTSAAKQSKREISNSLIDTIRSDKSPYFKYNSKTGKYKTITDIANIDLNGSNIRTYTSFLNNIGINFTESELSKLNNNQLGVFRKSVEGIKKSFIWLSKTPKNEQDTSAIDGIVNLSPKTLDIDGQLFKLGLIKSILENPVYESTYFNINGERTQTHVGGNMMSNFFDNISRLTNINQLRGDDPTSPIKSNFSYILTDSFSKGSVMLKKMFDVDYGGDRIKGTEDLMAPMFVDGIADENKGKKKESSKLTQRQRYIQELNLNLEGIYSNLVSGDASNEYALRMHTGDTPFVSQNGYSNGLHQSIFRDYFISEVNLARENRDIKEVKGRKKGDLRFFKEILGEEVHSEITSKTNLKKSPEQLYKDYEGKIRSAVDKFIKEDADNTQLALIEYNVIKDGNFGFDISEVEFSKNEDVSQAQLNEMLETLSTNYMIANIEMHKLLYSDPYQYSDELKRIKNFSSPRQVIIHGSSAYNTALHKELNRDYSEGDIGYKDMTKDYFRVVTIDDILSDNELPGYEEPYEETDGGGYITLKGHRVLKFRAGQWTPENERQYRYDIAWEKQYKAQDLSIDEIKKQGLTLSMDEIDLLDAGNPSVKSTYTPVKPIVSGNKANGRSYNDVVLHKFALVPISFRILHEIKENSNASKLYNKMQAENVDYAVYKSGVKVGAEKTFSVYDKGQFNEAPFETTEEKNNIDLPQGVSKIPFSIVGIQTEVPSKDTNDVTQGSQITVLSTMDLLDAGVPVDFAPEIKDQNERFSKWLSLSEEDKMKSEIYKEIKNNEDILKAKNQNGYRTLLRKLGIVKTADGFVLGDVDKLINTLREQLSFQQINDNIINSLKGFKKGQVVIEATPAYRQIRNILYAIADRNITSQKITGGQKVQVTSALLESNRAEAKVVKTKDGDKLVYQSKILDFYKNKDGKRVCQIMLARWFDSDKTDEELLNEWYKTNEDGTRELTEEGKAVLSGIAFRIPTQKQNSIDVFEIIKFLPKEFGDSVIVPSALVKKAGSDFDIDKLSIYLKNVLTTRFNSVTPIKFLTNENSTVEERYANWVIESSDRDSKKYVKFLSSNVIANIKENFKTKLNAIQEKYKNEIAYKKEELYKGYAEAIGVNQDKLVLQESYLKELFDVGKKVFKNLSTNLKEDYFSLRNSMSIDGIEGPREIENYLTLTLAKLSDNKNADDVDTLNDLVEIYKEELRVLGENENFINTFQKQALQLFRDNKNVQIQKINAETKKIFDKTRETHQNEEYKVNSDIVEELVKMNNLPSLEEFKKFSIYNQNTKKSLENAYIDSLQKLITHPSNFNRLVKPNSADDLKKITSDINRQTGRPEADYSSVGNMLKRTFMNPLRQDFVSGKYAIGIAATGQTGLAKRQRTHIYIDTKRIDDGTINSEDKKWLGDGKIKFKNFNKLIIDGEEQAILSGIKSSGTDTDISDINSQVMDGYVDISKGAWIMELGAKQNVTSTYSLLFEMGVPKEDVAYFMKQPIISDYLRTIENNGYSWLFIDTYVDDMKKKYRPSKEYADTGARVVEIPSSTELFKMLSFNDPSNKVAMPDLQKAQQQFILDEFLKYAMIANHNFLVTQATNYDTATINDSLSIFQKRLQLEKARKTIISSVDRLMDASFVGELKDVMYDVRDAYSTILISDKKENSSGGEPIRNVMEAVLTPYASLPARDFIKVSQRAKDNLFDWAMQNDRNQNLYLQQILLGTSTEESAAKQIMDYVEKVKANPKHPLNKNLVINSLKLESGSKITSFTKDNKINSFGKPDNLYINGRDNKVYEQNQIINSFEEIKEDLISNNKDLYGKLLRVAILQSGLSASPISFTQLLPYEDFTTIYNETLSKLENMPNLANFYNIHAFERQNYNNTDIIPFKKATLRLDKNQNLYNINEKFIDEKLRATMDKGIIPKVINVSKFSAEGRSNFMVYSWESPISKNDKIRAKKAGDKSYINKALMQKVYKSDGTPLIQTSEYNGKVYENYIYKAINAWGDSFRAQEFYDFVPVVNEQGKFIGKTAPASKFDNDFMKVEKITNYAGEIIRIGEVEDSVIEDIMEKDAGPIRSVEGYRLLKDGNMYPMNQINGQMLEDMGYNKSEIGRIIKEIC